jgi:O-antigen ligase
VFVGSCPLIKIQEFTTNKFPQVAVAIMAVGLFLQLTGKILYTSSGVNNSHVYLLFIASSVVASIWLVCKHPDFFSREVRLFLFFSALFMSVCSVSAAWGDGGYSVLYLLKRSALIFFYLVGIICLVSVSEVKHIKTFLLIVTIIAAIGAVLSVYYQLCVLGKEFGWRTFRIGEMGYGDWVDLGHPVIAGLYMGVFAVISMALISQGRSTLNYVSFIVLLALIPYIFLTFSRTTWIAGAVSGLFLLFFTRSRILVWAAICVGLAFLIVVGLYFDEFTREITHRQFSGRGQGWMWAINHLGENVFLGHGYDHTFWKGNFLVHAHNLYLQVTYEQGLAGLGSLLAMLSIVCRSYWKNRKDDLTTLGFSLVVFLLTAMLVEIDYVIARPGIYWTIFWFPLAFTLGAVNRVYLLEKTKSSCDS